MIILLVSLTATRQETVAKQTMCHISKIGSQQTIQVISMHQFILFISMSGPYFKLPVEPPKWTNMQQKHSKQKKRHFTSLLCHSKQCSAFNNDIQPPYKVCEKQTCSSFSFWSDYKIMESICSCSVFKRHYWTLLNVYL